MVEVLFLSTMWFLFLSLMGGIFFLLLMPYFQKVHDIGYCVSKTLGLLITSYIVFLLCHLHIPFMTFSQLLIWIVLVLFIIWGIVIHTKNNFECLKIILEKNLKFIIWFELLSYSVFILFACLKSYAPDIAGTNKLSDLALMTGILHTDFLPSQDVFLAGYPLNYFYFAHLCFVVPMKALHIDASTGFNLIPPTVLLLVIQNSFGLFLNYTKKVSYGLLGVLFVVFLSNFEPIVQVFREGLVAGFNWWNESHFIAPYFIESPFWSFSLGSVHTNFIVIPFVLLYFYLAYINNLDVSSSLDNRVKRRTGLKILVLACLLMANPWIFLAISLHVVILALVRSNKKGCRRFFMRELFVVFGMVFLFTLPFLLTYQFVIEGIVFNFPDHLTSIPNLFIMFGPPLMFILLYLMIRRVWFHEPFMRQMALFAICLLLFGECFYLKDVFPDFPKMITTSHLYIVLRIVLGILGALSIYHSWKYIKNKYIQDLYFSFAGMVLLACTFSIGLLCYWTSGEFAPEQYGRQDLPTLQGNSYLQNMDKDKYDVIQFIQKNISPKAVILQGYKQGHSSELGQIASMTGNRTILAFDGDEYFYRGDSVTSEIQKRLRDIEAIYTAKDKQLIQNLLTQYSVDYIYTGKDESLMYGAFSKEFTTVGDIVYRFKEGILYKVR